MSTVMEFRLARVKVLGPINRTGDRVHPMHIFNGFLLPKKGGNSVQSTIASSMLTSHTSILQGLWPTDNKRLTCIENSQTRCPERLFSFPSLWPKLGNRQWQNGSILTCSGLSNGCWNTESYKSRQPKRTATTLQNFQDLDIWVVPFQRSYCYLWQRSLTSK